MSQAVVKWLGSSSPRANRPSSQQSLVCIKDKRTHSSVREHILVADKDRGWRKRRSVCVCVCVNAREYVRVCMCIHTEYSK